MSTSNNNQARGDHLTRSDLSETAKSCPMYFSTSSITGFTTNSATATNCVSLYDLRGIH